jgi:competence ComEA-like helix-hairpin-helix protein
MFLDAILMKYCLALVLCLFPLHPVLPYDLIWEKDMTVRRIEQNNGNQPLMGNSLKININTADKCSLMKLSGIGPKKAEAIIAYRLQHGLFKSIRDISKIKGMSPKTMQHLLEKNKDVLTVKD